MSKEGQVHRKTCIKRRSCGPHHLALLSVAPSHCSLGRRCTTLSCRFVPRRYSLAVSPDSLCWTSVLELYEGISYGPWHTATVPTSHLTLPYSLFPCAPRLHVSSPVAQIVLTPSPPSSFAVAQLRALERDGLSTDDKLAEMTEARAKYDNPEFVLKDVKDGTRRSARRCPAQACIWHVRGGMREHTCCIIYAKFLASLSWLNVLGG